MARIALSCFGGFSIDVFSDDFAPVIDDPSPHGPRSPIADGDTIDFDDRPEAVGSGRKPGFVGIDDVIGLDVVFDKGHTHLCQNFFQDSQADAPQDVVAPWRNDLAITVDDEV